MTATLIAGIDPRRVLTEVPELNSVAQPNRLGDLRLHQYRKPG
jgi:hypothetical protein